MLNAERRSPIAVPSIAALRTNPMAANGRVPTLFALASSGRSIGPEAATEPNDGSQGWPILAKRLRREIAAAGKLLSLFEQMQVLLYRHAPEYVVEASHGIESQILVLVRERQARLEAVADFAVTHHQAASTPLPSLLVFFPAEVRPLLRALVSEANRLGRRVRRGCRCNQRLLQHASGRGPATFAFSSQAGETP